MSPHYSRSTNGFLAAAVASASFVSDLASLLSISYTKASRPRTPPCQFGNPEERGGAPTPRPRPRTAPSLFPPASDFRQFKHEHERLPPSRRPVPVPQSEEILSVTHQLPSSQKRYALAVSTCWHGSKRRRGVASRRFALKSWGRRTDSSRLLCKLASMRAA